MLRLKQQRAEDRAAAHAAKAAEKEAATRAKTTRVYEPSITRAAKATAARRYRPTHRTPRTTQITEGYQAEDQAWFTTSGFVSEGHGYILHHHLQP
jgi:hypothetical protein